MTTNTSEKDYQNSIVNYLENHGAFYAGILIVSIFVFILILIIFMCCPTIIRH